jgi:formiminotetrahydrofolate cyclodeaminase
MVKEWSLEEFLARTASDEPTPGGGSHAALVGALSAALSGMVCHFTLGRKKFKDVEPKVKELLEQADSLRAKLTDLIQGDIDAYEKVAAAYKMPRKTKEEKKARQLAIIRALKDAVKVPMEVAQISFDLIKLSWELLKVGNPQLIGDVGCAAAFAVASFESASILIEYNLNLIGDEKLKEEIGPMMDRFSKECRELYGEIKEVIMKCMRGSA